MATEKGVEAVERALSLLDAIPGSGKPSLSLHELSLATGFYKSTILLGGLKWRTQWQILISITSKWGSTAVTS